MSTQKKPKPPRYRVVATYIDRPSEHDDAQTRREAKVAEREFRRRGCDGLRVEVYVEGIGYVLDEGNK